MSHWRDLLIELGCRSFLFGTNESVSEQPFTLPLNFLWLSIVFLKFDSLAPWFLSYVTASLMNGLVCEPLIPARWPRRRPPQPRLRSLSPGTSLLREPDRRRCR